MADKFTFYPEGVCSMMIEIELDGDTIKDVVFTGGCNGNLKAIPILVDGWTVEQIEEKCKGITCGRRPTSCADQLALAVRAAYEHAKQN